VRIGPLVDRVVARVVGRETAAMVGRVLGLLVITDRVVEVV